MIVYIITHIDGKEGLLGIEGDLGQLV